MVSQLTYDPLELQFQYETQTKQVLDENKKATYFWNKPGKVTTTQEEETIRSTICENTKKIMASASLESLSKNQQMFTALLLSKNTLEIEDLTCTNGGGIIIDGVTMRNDLTYQSDITLKNSVKTTMMQTMSTSVSDAICDKKAIGGSTLEGVIDSVVGGIGDSVDTGTKTLGAVLGASSETNTSKKEVDFVKNIIKTSVDSYLNAKLESDNIQKAVQEAQAANTVALRRVKCEGDVNIRNIDQMNVVSMFLTAMFENFTDTDLENEMLTAIENEIKSEYTSTGDIADIGAALADSILAVGAAAKDVGAGIAAAITPVTNLGAELGDDAKDLGTNLGDDAAGAFETAMLAMIAPAIVCIIVVGVVMVYSQSKGGKNA